MPPGTVPVQPVGACQALLPATSRLSQGLIQRALLTSFLVRSPELDQQTTRSDQATVNLGGPLETEFVSEHANSAFEG